MKLFIRAHDLGVKGEEAIVSRLCELGLDGVQLVAYKSLPDIQHVPGAITPARAKSVYRTLSEAGKTVPLIGAYFNPVHPDKAKVGDGIAIFEDYLRVARDFGCGLVGSETGSYNGDKWTYNPMNESDEALERVVSVFRRLADTAAECGVCIGMEGARAHVCRTPARLDEAVRMIGRGNIRIIFDLYNYLDSSNVGEMYDILGEGLRLFAGRIAIYHIKDCVISGSGELVQCGVGKGIFDYKRIIGMIGAADPDANLVFEGTTGDDIADAVRYIKGIIQ